MTDAKPPRSSRRLFASAVLGTEIVVVLLVGLVAFGLRLAPAAQIWAVVGGAALACIITIGLLRSRVGLVLGSLVQLGLILSGLIVSMMWFVGAVYAVIWIIGLRLGSRMDREKADRAKAAAQ